MPADVQSMFYRETFQGAAGRESGLPWHGLGKMVPDEFMLDSVNGPAMAGLDWEVGLKDTMTVDGIPLDRRATYRVDTGKILGNVGPGYRVFQNTEAFKFFQPYLDSKQVVLHTAGALGEGERIWCLAEMVRDEMEIAVNDIVKKFLLISNSHDGKMAIRVGFTPIRVVCSNTLAMAHDCTESNLLRVKHTGKTLENLEKIREIMDLTNQQFEATAEQYRYLATKDINSKDLEKYVKLVMEIKDPKAGKEMHKKTAAKLSSVVQKFEVGAGNDQKGVRGTYWAAYNAVTDYLSHSYGRTTNNRLDSLWFGPSLKRNQSALNIALEMATAA